MSESLPDLIGRMITAPAPRTDAAVARPAPQPSETLAELIGRTIGAPAPHPEGGEAPNAAGRQAA